MRWSRTTSRRRSASTRTCTSRSGTPSTGSRRALEDHARRQRGDVKSHEEQPHGLVSKLFPDRGYGFIETPDGIEVYFHKNSVADPGFDRLTVGTEVRFVEEDGEHGPQASTVAAAR